MPIPSLRKLQVTPASFESLQQFLSQNASLEELKVENIQGAITNKDGMIQFPRELVNLKKFLLGYVMNEENHNRQSRPS